MSILETIEAFYVVRNSCKVARLSNFVENIINKNSCEPTRTFRDLWSLVPINHEMHSRSYDLDPARAKYFDIPFP